MDRKNTNNHAGTALRAGVALVSLAAFLSAPAHAGTDTAPTTADLMKMSIEQLMNVRVTSVSKSAEPLSDAPAAIYVITHDEIMRSGARTLPEMLRLAPNLQVARINAASYAISARGFNLYGSDKLLVLIDGRSIYTPFFSGVFWDAHEVLPENVERIEVISGPGATLWGANAVNGVINIITRRAGDTQGGLLDAAGGNLRQEGALQYGGRLGRWRYRVYGDGFRQVDETLPGGGGAQDGWHKAQGGFRADWARGNAHATIEGDAYEGSEHALALTGEHIAGGSLLGRWSKRLSADSSLQVQASFDRGLRDTLGHGADDLNIYDLSMQHSFVLGAWQRFVWGAGFRLEQDHFVNDLTPAIPQFFDPTSRDLTRTNLFAQDTLAFSDALKVTLGLKLEKDAYISLEPLPSVRVAWKPSDRDLLWAAVSRAIRAPSREDRDLNEAAFAGGKPVVYLVKGGQFQAERLIAYEAGYRAQPLPRLSFSVSLYYDDYSDLRDLEPTPVVIFPIMFANAMEGHTYGTELWGTWQATDWWRLSFGGNLLRENLRFKPGSFGVGGLEQAGNDPEHQLSLRSSMDLPHGFTVDTSLRQIGSLPNPAVPAYVELDAHVGWSVSPSLTLSLTGSNLLHAHHLEFIHEQTTDELGRSVLFDARWRF